MLKYQEIISMLTEDQKLRLVTDFSALRDETINALGVPRVSEMSLDEISAHEGNAYPTFNALAQSWNGKLLSSVAADLSYRICEEANLVDTPSAQIKSSVYARGMGEDPYFTARLVSDICKGLDSSSMAACVTDCSVRAVDTEMLDSTPQPDVIAELFTRPFTLLGRSGAPFAAVKSTRTMLHKGWKAVNLTTVEKQLKESLPKEVCFALSSPDQERMVEALSASGELVCSGSTGALRAAVADFRRMQEGVERGMISVEEFNRAIREGVAVDPASLDTAVDAVIEFATKVAAKRKIGFTPTESEAKKAALRARLKEEQTSQQGEITALRASLPLKAATESIVMLKNASSVLPIATGKKVAIIGVLHNRLENLAEVAADKSGKHRCTLLGVADGYNLDGETEESEFNAAIELARKADTVIMFMGLESKREKELGKGAKLMLSADQLKLYDAVTDLNKSVIVCLIGEHLPDMSFDAYCGGVLFVPCLSSYSAAALCSVIFGDSCPSGRLSYSAYNDTDEYLAGLRAYRDSGKNRVGKFIGYRHYTSSGVKIKYPFGYGLSYSKFEYKKIKVSGNEVAVTVHNVGKYTAAETVQVYVGKIGSALVRPTRELKGFEKVELKPHEKKTVKITITPESLAVYDAVSGKMKTEGGKYAISVGPNCADIKLKAEITVTGEKLQPTGDKLSDFLQSASNIIDGGYTLPTSGKKNKVTVQSLPDFPYERLFLDEFGVDADDGGIEGTSTVRAVDFDTDYVGAGVSVKEISTGLFAHFVAHGLQPSLAAAYNVPAAMAASRIVFVASDDKELFADFVGALGGMFGSKPILQSVEGVTSSDDLFFTVDSEGNEKFTPLYKMAADSRSVHSFVQIAALDDVNPATINDYFSPWIRYVGNPENDRITYMSGGEERVLSAAPNIWFVMRISMADASNIPAHFAGISTLFIPELTRCEGKLSSAKQVNYYQLVDAFDNAEGKWELTEKEWKRIDKLQSYVSTRTGSVISNKMWRQMERYVSVQLALGAKNDKVMDCVVAYKLLPLFAPLLKGKLTKDDGDFAHTLDTIFGEDVVAASKSLAGKLGLVAKK